MTTQNDFPFPQQGEFKHRVTMRKSDKSNQSRKNHLKTEQDSHLLHFWVYNSPFGLHVNCCRNSACWKNIYHHNLKNHRAQKGRQEQPRNFTLLAIKSLSTTMGDPNPPDPKTNKTKQNRWSTARLWLNSTGAITSKPKKKKNTKKTMKCKQSMTKKKFTREQCF